MPALVGLLLLAMTSVCSAGLFEKDETVGERFRKAIGKIRQSCESRKLAPGEVCGEVAKLKPADPLATEEGRFAHSIKIPNPVPEDSGYRSGMTSEQYFDHLCKTEAGEFIYKMVENVEGLYMMRPRKEATDWELEHLYALEDPYGHMDAEARDPEFFFVGPVRYRFLEQAVDLGKKSSWSRQFLDASYFVPPPAEAQYERYLGSDGRDPQSMIKLYVTKRSTRYGYTWRGIVRPHDREMGIAGGELIVLNMDTREILGVRRGYIRTGNVHNNSTGVWWLTGQACPNYDYRGHRNRDFDFAYWFIGKVIKPINYETSFMELMNAK
ncbi:MAG: hypothetical protein KIT40_03040 [Nitrospira sp.]|nr:hypothetical protein [Nitrospira sp.]